MFRSLRVSFQQSAQKASIFLRGHLKASPFQLSDSGLLSLYFILFYLFLPYPAVGTLPRPRSFQRSSCYCYSVTTPSLTTSSEHPMWYYTIQGTILSRKKSIRGDFHSVCYYRVQKPLTIVNLNSLSKLPRIDFFCGRIVRYCLSYLFYIGSFVQIVFVLVH